MQKIVLSAVFLFLSSISFTQAISWWSPVTQSEIAQQEGTRYISPSGFFAFSADLSQVAQLLTGAPPEAVGNPGHFEFTIPAPDGTPAVFAVWSYEMMEPNLANQFMGIRTFFGKGITDPYAVIRMDYTYQGFHAMVLSPFGTYYIDPVLHLNTTYYQSYFKKDLENPHAGYFSCETVGEETSEDTEVPGAEMLLPNGSQLKSYRLALAATGEYTAFHGGTVNGALSAQVTAMNRVNGIYEKDAAVRMIIVGNNNLLIYTNANTDPYTNNNGSTMLGQNQSNLNSIIGSANYDIGHVFSTGGGGIASLGSVCVGSRKAQGVTGLPNPIGDGFYVDYVAHEIGHQFDAGHTFNSSAGSCNGNRSTNNAYEPGSGSTIMGYAGICFPDNIQSNSDDYFHTRSYRAIYLFITSGNGNNCDTPTPTGNTPPTVDAGPSSYYVPKSTPFRLTATATDADGHPLTYCWEQYDLGASIGLTGTPSSGTPPLFRSFEPDTSATRVFPRMNTIVNNLNDNREKLPTYARKMRFRATVRDNQPNGGGISLDTMSFNVAGNAGPFLVTYPNVLLNWASGTTETVTWDVSNTHVAPVNCASVNILLSTDGGYTYPIVLASNVPNNGSCAVVVPNLGNTVNTCRVMVEAAGNIFFDISNQDFVIQPGPLTPPVAAFTMTTNEICAGTSVHFTDNSAFNPSSWSWSFQGGTPAVSTLQNPQNIQFATAGIYMVTLVAINSAGSDTITQQITVNPLPVATFTTTPASNGMNNGSATVIPSGGTAPYTYSWVTSPIQTTATAVNLYAGTQTVIITDANGCSVTLTVIVPSSTGVQEENIMEYTLFPNPVEDILTVQTTEKMLDVSLWDMTGRMVFQEISPAGTLQLNLQSLGSGVYILKLVSGEKQATSRLLKQ